MGLCTLNIEDDPDSGGVRTQVRFDDGFDVKSPAHQTMNLLMKHLNQLGTPLEEPQVAVVERRVTKSGIEIVGPEDL